MRVGLFLAALSVLANLDLTSAVCSAIAEGDRESCPFTGQTACEAQGCCYDGSVQSTGVPVCYFDRVTTSNGPCVFPFIYGTKTYYSCTIANSDKPICALTDNYDRDGKFGYCDTEETTAAVTTTAAPTVTYPTVAVRDDCKYIASEGITECVFPFTYDGTTYTECTTADTQNNEPWCALTSDYDANPRKWCYCKDDTTSATTTTTKAPTQSTPKGDCTEDTFILHRGKQTYFGTLQEGVSVLQVCLDNCLADPQCEGFDFNTDKSRCYNFYQNSPNSVNDFVDAANVNHYIRDRCPATPPAVTTPSLCTDTFTKIPSTQALGGIANNEPTVKACEELCLQNAGCVGFDFNSDAALKCILYNDKDVFDNTTPAVNIDHYVRNECGSSTSTTDAPTTSAAECKETYQNFGAYQAFGGKGVPDTEDIADCEAACSSVPDCAAFDFDANRAISEGRCYWFTDEQYATITRVPNRAMQHFIRPQPSERCTGISTPKSSSPTSPTTTTTSPASSTPKECEDEYEMSPGVFSLGGQSYPQQTVEQCKAVCRQVIGCLGFDYSPNNPNVKCFLHFNLANFMAKQKAENTGSVAQYVRKDCNGTSTPVGTTPEPPCDDFEEFVGKFSYKGDKKEGVASVDGCKVACRQDDKCLFFDFNTVDFTCWVHVDEKDAFDRPDVTQYRKRECTTSVSVSVTPQVCGIVYEKRENRASSSGTALSEVKTLEECRAACTAEESCVSIDFVRNPGGTRCYWHDKVKAANTNNAVDQYVKKNTCPTTINTKETDGPCVPEFTELQDTGSIGGVKNDKLKKLDECIEYCNEQGDCVGFDYNDKKVDHPCYFFTDIDKLENSAFVRDGIVQYRITKRCDPSSTTAATTVSVTGTSGTTVQCFVLWFVSEDSNVRGAYSVDDISDVEKCREECVSVGDCFGIDFNKKGPKYCWIHTGNASEAQLGVRSDVDHHRIEDRCSPSASSTGRTSVTGTSSTTESSSSASTTLVTGTTTTTSSSSVSPTGQSSTVSSTGTTKASTEVTTATPCEEVFVASENMNAPGGELYAGFEGEEKCGEKCLSMSDCLGFDLDNDACWIHTNKDKFAIKKSRQGVTHYVREERCDTSPSRSTTVEKPDDCETEWRQFSNQRGLTAIESAADTSDPLECQKFCIDVPNCVALDFNTNSAARHQCWLYIDVGPAQLSPKAGIDHWELVKRCGTTVSSTARVPCDSTKVTYSEEFNVHFLGGTLKPGVFTVEECKDLCSKDTTCLAIDFNNLDETCWFHTNQDNLAADRKQNTISIDHYRITSNKCTTAPVPTTTTTTKAPTTTTTTATTTTTVAGTTTTTSTTLSPTTTTTAAPISTPTPEVCETDVLLVIDTSQYTLQNINALLQLVIDTTDYLSFPTNTRFAAISFGATPNVMFNFNSYANRQVLKAAILNAPRQGGNTDYFSMLTMAEIFIKSSNRGNRQNVRDVVLVFTYGYEPSMNFNPAQAQVVADRIVSDPSVNLMFVATNQGRDPLLGSLARRNDDNHRIYTNNFFASPNEVRTIAEKVCRVPETSICIADIAFVIDDSGSIRDRNQYNPDFSDNFQKVADFLKQIVQMVNIGFDKTRVSLLRFSNNATFEFFLDDYTTQAQYEIAIDAMVDNYVGGNTNTTGGLYMARTVLLDRANGERASVPNVVMVVTDGQPTVEEDDLDLQANTLKNMLSTTVIAVGVTDDVDQQGLARIASSTENIFQVDDFASLANSEFLGTLADDLCQDSAIQK